MEEYRYHCDDCGAEYLSDDSELVYCDSEKCLDADVRLRGPYLIGRIYRSYADTEITELGTQCECPYCGYEDLQYDKSVCGQTYVIQCEECEKEYEMYFDAD